jgi:catechol 2,3-dioxygenase-like lactoylglutathione lyase family enzyme
MRPEFTHCALHVCDLGQSIAFYQSYCGLGIVKEHGQGNAHRVDGAWR